jgi:hypothetical protein
MGLYPAAAGAALLGLTFVAIARIPATERIEMQAESRFDAAWADIMPMKKADRLQLVSVRAPEPTPKHPDTATEPPAMMPPLVVVEDQPGLVRRKHTRASAKYTVASDVCSRHKMRKVVTRGGKSWRCKH